MTRRAAVALVACAFSQSACLTPRSLGELQVLRVNQVLAAPAVDEAIRKAVLAGNSMCGLLAVVLGFVIAWRFMNGRTRALEGFGAFFGWLLASAFILATWNHALGVDTTIRHLGAWLGDQLKPSAATVWGPYVEYATRTGKLAQKLLELAGKGTADPMAVVNLDPSDAAAYWVAQGGAYLIAANGSAAYLASTLLQSVQAWLFGLYTCIGPLCVPTLILPSTRSMFFGWVRAYLSLALWAPLMGITERIALSIPQFANMIGTDAGGQDAARVAEAMMMGTLNLAIVNILMIAAYLSIPVAAHMLVNAAGRPFHGALR